VTATAPLLQKRCVKSQCRVPDGKVPAGGVNTQAVNRLRIVDICRPDLFAFVVPAARDDST